MFMTPTQSYILIATLLPVLFVSIRTIIHNERKHVEQREIQRIKWRARFDEVRNRPDLLVNPSARERSRVARRG
jgi:hypothetical protein